MDNFTYKCERDILSSTNFPCPPLSMEKWFRSRKLTQESDSLLLPGGIRMGERGDGGRYKVSLPGTTKPEQDAGNPPSPESASGAPTAGAGGLVAAWIAAAAACWDRRSLSLIPLSLA
jgi:hypothetical protein